MGRSTIATPKHGFISSPFPPPLAAVVSCVVTLIVPLEFAADPRMSAVGDRGMRSVFPLFELPAFGFANELLIQARSLTSRAIPLYIPRIAVRAYGGILLDFPFSDIFAWTATSRVDQSLELAPAIATFIVERLAIIDDPLAFTIDGDKHIRDCSAINI